MTQSIYIFHPDDYPLETLWEIVRDYKRFRDAGSIGDCTMRQLAQKERSSIGSSFTALDMEGVAKRAAFDARYELCGPFDDNWQELCLAAALRALADHRSPEWDGGPLCHWRPDERTRQELRNIAEELASP